MEISSEMNRNLLCGLTEHNFKPLLETARTRYAVLTAELIIVMCSTVVLNFTVSNFLRSEGGPVRSCPAGRASRGRGSIAPGPCGVCSAS
jgi:hypothetical protein